MSFSQKLEHNADEFRGAARGLQCQAFFAVLVELTKIIRSYPEKTARNRF
jgi:hypothetical protein